MAVENQDNSEELFIRLVKSVKTLFYKYSFPHSIMKKGITPIFTNAVMFWAVKFVIMVVIYFWLIAPFLQNSDPAVVNLVNIAYGFLTVFVVFALRTLDISGLMSFRK